MENKHEEIDQSQDFVKDLSQQVERTSEQLKKFVDMSEAINLVFEENRKNKDKIAVLEQKVETLELQVDEREDQNKKLKQENESFLKQINQMRALYQVNIEKLVNEIESLKKQILVLGKESKSLEESSNESQKQEVKVLPKKMLIDVSKANSNNVQKPKPEGLQKIWKIVDEDFGGKKTCFDCKLVFESAELAKKFLHSYHETFKGKEYGVRPIVDYKDDNVMKLDTVINSNFYFSTKDSPSRGQIMLQQFAKYYDLSTIPQIFTDYQGKEINLENLSQELKSELNI